MASFEFFTSKNKEKKYRLGVLDIPVNFLSSRNNGLSFSTNNNFIFEDNTNHSECGTNAKIPTPAISIPTFKGFPLCILPKLDGGQDEVSSLFSNLDFMLMGYTPDTIRNMIKINHAHFGDFSDINHDELNIEGKFCANKVIGMNKSGGYSSFGYLKQPKPQLANKDYIMYMMFRQPLNEGISSWIGSNGVMIQTEGGRVNINHNDIISCIENYQPVFYISPAEESQTSSYGKKISYRSIYNSDKMLLNLLDYHIKLLESKNDILKSGKDYDICKTGRNRTKILANIQGAHFKDYRVAASLAVWDLCQGTGRGLENVRFVKDGQANVELNERVSEQSKRAKLIDEIIIGVTIGGLGYNEESSIRAECIKEVVNHIPTNKLRFLSLCTGSPIEILQAIYLGVDIIECPYIYKCSQSGVALTYDLDQFWEDYEIKRYNLEEKTSVEKFLLQGDFSNVGNHSSNVQSFGGAKYINLSDRKYSFDLEKITSKTPVMYSKAYIHHLINSKEILGFSLLFMHNYWQYQGLLLSVRKAIKYERFEDFVTWFIYTQTDLHLNPVKLPKPVIETYTYNGTEKFPQ